MYLPPHNTDLLDQLVLGGKRNKNSTNCYVTLLLCFASFFKNLMGRGVVGPGGIWGRVQGVGSLQCCFFNILPAIAYYESPVIEVGRFLPRS